VIITLTLKTLKMTYKKTISSVEYQESVARAKKNPQNRVDTVRKSPYHMINGIPHKMKGNNWIPLTKIN